MPTIYLPTGIIQAIKLIDNGAMRDQAEEFDAEEYLLTFGKRLAKLRAAKGYSQDRVCLEAGFARGTLSKIESGKVDPKLTTLARIAETIGVPLKKITDLE
ncbi:MAG: helix-turn-helix domain-containing protein [bacterium]|jgi:DNA-binding XRE family transcriptional regulator